ncbi:MAG: ATP-dependent DNA helicase RecG, partial [Clostridia bacterium]
MDEKLMTDVHTLHGAGEKSKRGAALNKLGIFNMFDLVNFFPRDYEDRTTIKKIAQLTAGENACFKAIIAEDAKSHQIRAGLELIKVRAIDETGDITIVFFNQKYIKAMLKIGNTYSFYGKIVLNGGKRELQNPVFEQENAREKTGRIVPIYPLAAGISMNMLVQYIKEALRDYLQFIIDPIPEIFRVRYKLAHAQFSYKNIHFPDDEKALIAARRRLIFEELLVFSIGLARLKGRRTPLRGIAMKHEDIAEFYAALPFELTGAQKRAINDALTDMCGNKPMNRLTQGDVGSGKTVVAAACAYFCAKNGYQSALMAPTEILAAQHVSSVEPILKSLGLKTLCLTGSMSAAEKRKAKEKIASGEADVVIGTHALLTEDTKFARLGLVITDEQHRFGVSQRSALTSKGANPHLLVMSATPIPRTLALVLYGDLDVSIIDELPPGRKQIETIAICVSKRARAYSFIAEHIIDGRQVYIVCPLVAENDALELKSVEKYTETLKKTVFSEYKVAFIHGKMRAKEKNAVMSAFANGEINVLVSTTVIEVGVDVKNATVMVVENAERFGLAQLHQLRGRVGRGELQSYCILFSETQNALTKERLDVLCKTNDGFVISEEDLRLRGPGDFFGTKQHGVPELRI